MANSNWSCTHAHTTGAEMYRITVPASRIPRVAAPNADTCAVCGNSRGTPPQPKCPNTAHGYYTR